MCDNHHAARHIHHCPQCDLLVALPQLEHIHESHYARALWQRQPSVGRGGDPQPMRWWHCLCCCWPTWCLRGYAGVEPVINGESNCWKSRGAVVVKIIASIGTFFYLLA